MLCIYGEYLQRNGRIMTFSSLYQKLSKWNVLLWPVTKYFTVQLFYRLNGDVILLAIRRVTILVPYHFIQITCYPYDDFIYRHWSWWILRISILVMLTLSSQTVYLCCQQWWQSWHYNNSWCVNDVDKEITGNIVTNITWNVLYHVPWHHMELLNSWSTPSHYQNQCWDIIDKTLRNKLQWIFSRNSNIFIQENAFESVVCEKAAILSRPQWVKLQWVCII